MSDLVKILIKDGSVSFEKEDGDYLNVKIVTSGLTVERRIFIYSDINALKALFFTISENWKGWVGSRHFKSVEGDFSIIAHHNGNSHVNLRLEIKSNFGLEDGWFITLDSQIELGSLDAIAKDISKL